MTMINTGRRGCASGTPPSSGRHSCGRALVFDSFGGPLDVREVPAPSRRPAAWSSGSRPPASAAATGTAGWATTPTIVAAARARPRAGRHGRARSAPGVRGWRGRRPGHRAVRLRLRHAARSAPPATSRSARARRQPGFTHWGSFAEFVALDARRRQPGSRCPDGWPSPTRRQPRLPLRHGLPRGRAPGRGCGPASGSRCTAAAASACRRCMSPPRPAPGWSRSTSRPRRSTLAPRARGASDAVDARRRRARGGRAPSSPAAARTFARRPRQRRHLRGLDRSLRPRGRHVQVGLLPPTRGAPRCRWTG